MGGLVTKSCLTLYDPMDYTSQAPLSMGFPRQECWSGLPFPSPEDLPNPGINLNLLDFLPLSQGSPIKSLHLVKDENLQSLINILLKAFLYN